jgi:hypothetical protein
VVQHEKQRDKGGEAEGNLSGHGDGLAWRVTFAKGGLLPAKTGAAGVLVRHERLNQSAHMCGHVGHAHRKSPFVVIPRQHPHGASAHDFGLIGRKDG